MFWLGEVPPVDAAPYEFPHPQGLRPAFEVEYWNPATPEHKRFLLTNSKTVASATELKYTRVGWVARIHINAERYPEDRVCPEKV